MGLGDLLTKPVAPPATTPTPDPAALAAVDKPAEKPPAPVEKPTPPAAPPSSGTALPRTGTGGGGTRTATGGTTPPPVEEEDFLLPNPGSVVVTPPPPSPALFSLAMEDAILAKRQMARLAGEAQALRGRIAMYEASEDITPTDQAEVEKMQLRLQQLAREIRATRPASELGAHYANPVAAARKGITGALVVGEDTLSQTGGVLTAPLAKGDVFQGDSGVLTRDDVLTRIDKGIDERNQQLRATATVAEKAQLATEIKQLQNIRDITLAVPEADAP